MGGGPAPGVSVCRHPVCRRATNLPEAERDRWLARHDEGKDKAAAAQEAYRLRATMLGAFYALQLSSSGNDRLRELAREAVTAAYQIRTADTEPEMIRRAHHVPDAIDDMIAVARIGKPGYPG
jgi:hypothetical protein